MDKKILLKRLSKNRLRGLIVVIATFQACRTKLDNKLKAKKEPT
jgi:hypothetical protein